MGEDRRKIGQLAFILISFLIPILSVGAIPKIPHSVVSTQAEKPNILLIVIDSLRKDHLSYFGYHRLTSPLIDRLCREGIVFTNALSQASQSGPSIASLWTGLFPMHHGIQLYSYNQSYDPYRSDIPPFLDENLTCIAEYFQRADYSTFALVANPWIREEFGFAQGFDIFKSILSNDGRLLNQALQETLVYRQKEKPFFVYIHYMDTHAPYLNPTGIRGLYATPRGEPIYGMGYKDFLSSQDLDYTMALYDEQINYVNSLVGEIVSFLEKRSMMNNTILVLTSDHGEEFYEHLGLGHGLTVYSEVIDIFFLLYCPQLFTPRAISDRVQAVDLLPTLLDLSKIDYSRDEMDGRSLLSLILTGAKNLPWRERIFLSELGDKKAILDGDWKFIYNPFLQTEELYDLRRDKRERLNLADQKIRLRRRLKEKLFSLFQLPEKGKGVNTILRASQELEERLRSLGYLGQKNPLPQGEYLDLSRPISSKIDFSHPDFNPLQLIYGWKDIRKEGEKSYCRVGPFVKFVLRKGAENRKENLIIEGEIAGHSEEREPPAMGVYCEGKRLARLFLETGKLFQVKIRLPREIGRARPLEFTLTCQNCGTTGGFSHSPDNCPDCLSIFSVYFQRTARDD